MTAAIILAYTVQKCGIAIIQHILTRVEMRNSAHEENDDRNDDDDYDDDDGYDYDYDDKQR